MSVYQSPKSPYWQLELTHAGKRHARSSKIKIMGDKDAMEGTSKYLQYWNSYRKAVAVRDDYIAKLTATQTAQAMAQDIYHLRHGQEVPEVELSVMYDKWLSKIERSDARKRSERYLQQVQSALNGFANYCAKLPTPIMTMAAVSHDAALSFLDKKWAKGITAKTYNNCLQIMRSAFTLLQHEGGCTVNPFSGIRGRTRETVHKEPFSTAEAKNILRAAEAKGDDISHLIILGICSALRRGDACRLEWSSVSADCKVLAVRTSKTGKTVQIPVFPPLRRVLLARPRNSQYVFPDLARMISTNPDGVSLRVKKFLSDLGYDMDGETRSRGLKKANTRGYHSLRTTFVTLAFEAGLAESTIRQITGHTTDVIARYYYQPKPESIREEFVQKMATIFGEGEN